MPTLTFKTSDDEAAAIRRAARARRMSLSAYARYAMLTAPAAAPQAKRRADSMKPGRVVIATPPISDEALDAALHDY